MMHIVSYLTSAQILTKKLQYLYSGELDMTRIKTRDQRDELVRSVIQLIPEHKDRITKLMDAEEIGEEQRYGSEMLWAVNNPLFHDVVLVVSDGEKNVRRILAHKVVLCARSSYFKAMLTGGMKVCYYCNARTKSYQTI
mgnify:CR=1 FL=1